MEKLLYFFPVNWEQVTTGFAAFVRNKETEQHVSYRMSIIALLYYPGRRSERL